MICNRGDEKYVIGSGESIKARVTSSVFTEVEYGTSNDGSDCRNDTSSYPLPEGYGGGSRQEPGNGGGKVCLCEGRGGVGAGKEQIAREAGSLSSLSEAGI